MKIAFFSSRQYDIEIFNELNTQYDHKLEFFVPELNEKYAVLAKGHDAVCIFVNDDLNETVIAELAGYGIKAILLRCTGFNNVDFAAAKAHGIMVYRVGYYSPYSVAEYAMTLILALNRKVYKSYNRIKRGNFELEGLMGFDLHQKTVGVVGTGKIGKVFIDILKGFGCKVLAYDLFQNEDCLKAGVTYTELNQLFAESDIISLHCPLSEQNRHMINEASIELMKPGVMIINTSRGGLINTLATIEALKTGKIGSLGIDVYEEEAELFFKNLSDKIIQDDIFARLLTFPNVLISGHQAFFTKNALDDIANATLQNAKDAETQITNENSL
ncbi:2-hydroxyacid dehydrogenase [Solitalea sp. MAHUQ-68]|uniref:2-hydroxyacid dehydrogenase n=1 Tax=Solitalea agri TaxID=2953739 RepID=A0A9X2F065_9SPHI|nr:2-hydroxyacid dehydrogenase [Solitalea agri]MCO4291801.1 2-hydroxyacid dehydrogenase [Solitalea agri]